MYVKVGNDGVPHLYNLTQLRRDNPNVSFPRVFSDGVLAQFNVYRLSELPKPAHDEMTEKAVAREPANINGAWVLAYDIVALPPEEVAQKLAEKRANTSVTMRQARLALSQVGKLSLIDQAIQLIPEPDKTQISIEWEYAQTVDRTSPWISTMMGVLGMNDEELDGLFELASNL